MDVNIDTMPLLVLVTGLPGTGKSTIAEAETGLLGAPVLGHDWATSGLRPYPEPKTALEMMPAGHRYVGWSILVALTRAELRRGSPVVLDGVARSLQVDACRRLAAKERARLVVVLTTCADEAVHRSRLAGRRRTIPGWYELEWEDVERARASFEAPPAVDLELEATDDLEASICRLHTLVLSG